MDLGRYVLRCVALLRCILSRFFGVEVCGSFRCFPYSALGLGISGSPPKERLVFVPAPLPRWRLPRFSRDDISPIRLHVFLIFRFSISRKWQISAPRSGPGFPRNPAIPQTKVNVLQTDFRLRVLMFCGFDRSIFLSLGQASQSARPASQLAAFCLSVPLPTWKRPGKGSPACPQPVQLGPTESWRELKELNIVLKLKEIQVSYICVLYSCWTIAAVFHEFMASKSMVCPFFVCPELYVSHGMKYRVSIRKSKKKTICSNLKYFKHGSES